MAEEIKNNQTVDDNPEKKEKEERESILKKIVPIAKKTGKAIAKGAAFAGGVLGTAFVCGLAIGFGSKKTDDEEPENKFEEKTKEKETED